MFCRPFSWYQYESTALPSDFRQCQIYKGFAHNNHRAISSEFFLYYITHCYPATASHPCRVVIGGSPVYAQ